VNSLNLEPRTKEEKEKIDLGSMKLYEEKRRNENTKKKENKKRNAVSFEETHIGKTNRRK